LQRDELAARATAARAALLSLCEALSALVPVAPASGATATEPRRTVGAVVRDGTLRHYDEDDLLIVVADDPAACQRFLDNPRSDLSLADAYPEDEFVRWATREECERHGIPYVARPLPGAPLAAPSPSPAATPAAWVPSVGDVVTWGLCLWLYRVEAVTATSAYVRCCDKRGDIGDCTEVLLETPDLRPATSSERAAAGLPPVDAPAFDEAKEREAAFASLGHNVAGTRDYVDGFVMGWLARARVAAKEPRSGDDRPASGQSATKPVDRGALLDAMRAAFREWRRTPEDTRDTEVVATDAAIAFMAKGGAS